MRSWLPACIGLCAMSALAATVGVRHVAPLRQGASLLDDLRLANFAPPRPQREDVIVLTIGEDTLAQFPFRSPINRRLVAELVTTLAQRNLRALGIDLIFDQPTTAADDTALLAALDAFPKPLIIAVGDATNGLTPRQLAFQEQFLAGREGGLAGMLMTNGTVRHIYPGEQTANGYQPGFATALARAAGADPPLKPTLLYYRTAQDGTPAIRTFPAQHLAVLPAAWFDDAIVIIGADLPNQDTFRTPLSAVQGATMTGVFVHAHALAQLLDGAEFPLLGAFAEAVLVTLAALGGVLLPFAPIRLHWKAAIALGTLGGYGALTFIYFATAGVLLPLVAPALASLLALAFGTAYARRLDQVEKRLVRNAFGRYVSPQIIEQIIADPRKLALGGEKREMSFVFSDLEGFTTLVESLSPERALGLLQSYLDGMLRIAFEHGGTVDRIVGDGIAVFFGAPLAQADHTQRAVRCALAWDRYCESFRAAHRTDGIALGITRIGVHTGTAIVGNVGTAERLHYTAHGDCVNIAARLEGANRYLGTRICLSREVTRSSPEITFLPVGRLVLKGRTQDLECVTAGDHLPTEVLDDYLAAYELLEVDCAASRLRFATLAARAEHRGLPAFHWQRLQRGELGARIVLEGK